MSKLEGIGEWLHKKWGLEHLFESYLDLGNDYLQIEPMKVLVDYKALGMLWGPAQGVGYKSNQD
jgi:hypothetical protein